VTRQTWRTEIIGNTAETSKRTILPLTTAGTVLLGLYLWIARLPNALSAIYLYLGIFGAAFVIYVICVVWTRRVQLDGRAIWLIVGFAILFRLVFIASWPTISTDFYRYLWDGKVTNAGINPYRYAPQDPELKPLRSNFRWGWVNYKWLHTPYPPGAQMIFSAAYKLGPANRIVLRAIFLLFDLTTILLLMRLLGAVGLPRRYVIVYAWSPLVITELAFSSHVDVLCITAMVLAFTLSIARIGGRIAGPAALGWSTMLKIFTAPLALLFARRHGARALLVCGLAAVIVAAPYAGHPKDMISALLFMASKVNVNTSVYDILDRLFSLFTPAHNKAASMMAISVVGIASVAIALRDQSDDRQMLRSGMSIIGLIILMSPVLYPWYVTWIIPFLCFFLSPAWLLFTGLIAISYLLPFHDRALWIRLVEYMPLYGLMVYEALRRRRQ
jgi:alpha-1,6-mannosyltransferase